MSAEVRVPEPHEVDFVLTWRLDSDGRLAGSLDAENVADRTIRLPGKPNLDPLGVDGASLGAECIVTLEFRLPGYVDLAPGERARALVFWSGWSGPPCSGRFRISWQGGESVEVTAQGDHQPLSPGPPTNLSAGWWQRL